MDEINIHKIYRTSDYCFKNYTQLSRQDLELILSWRNDDSIRSLMYNKSMIDLAAHLDFVKKLETRRDCCYWLALCGNECIGCVNLTSVDYDKGLAELGYFIKPEYMGTGMGFDFVYNAIEFAVCVLGFHQLYGATIISNIQAAKLDEYFGFVKTGEKIINDQGSDYKYSEYLLQSDYFIKNKDFLKNIDNFIAYIKQK